MPRCWARCSTSTEARHWPSLASNRAWPARWRCRIIQWLLVNHGWRGVFVGMGAIILATVPLLLALAAGARCAGGGAGRRCGRGARRAAGRGAAQPAILVHYAGRVPRDHSGDRPAAAHDSLHALAGRRDKLRRRHGDADVGRHGGRDAGRRLVPGPIRHRESRGSIQPALDPRAVRGCSSCRAAARDWRSWPRRPP